MINYLSKFYKHLSDDCEPLRQLTHRDSLCEWTDVQDEAFKRLKEKLTQVPVLKYYSPEEELTLQCDASETGLGAALTQQGKPVAFASRALTLTERGYAQIEKECLAIVFGMEKIPPIYIWSSFDYYSNFWEIDYLPDTKSSTVIRKLKAHFARQGIPNIVFSDNGPQYSSTEFANFSRKWEFQHHTSSPGYPQSNGKVESAVKTAKRLMKKAKLAGQDPYLALLDHRNTPTQGLTTSPAQRLLSRRTRTLLPIGDRLLQPKVTDDRLALRRNTERQTKYYNRTAKDMDTLNPGDVVRVQPFEQHTLWSKARVCNTRGNRSYDVELDNGRVLRRNRRHLRRAA
uniref:Integrase catalytic domain-containing protein n=1 Tax=Nothobranchius kuhntae TaxID=321403 RepID=A0A1A8J489_NOTKU